MGTDMGVVGLIYTVSGRGSVEVCRGSGVSIHTAGQGVEHRLKIRERVGLPPGSSVDKFAVLDPVF
jgi:hypothetical protein